MSGAPPTALVHCGHRGAARRAHLAALADIAGALAAPGAARVVLQCGAGPLPRAHRAALDGGGERVRVRLDGAGHAAQARRLAAAAIAFQAAGPRPPPRQGALALVHRAPPVTADDRCVGTARCARCLERCPSGALSAGAAGRPEVLGRACTLCGACVGACPWGAMGWTWAPAAALEARLDAALGGAGPDGPWALLLEERAGPPRPEVWEETEAPALAAVVALRLPPRTLGAAPILRAVERGASAVAVVIPAARPALAATVRGVRSVLAAAGRGDVAVIAASDATVGLALLAARAGDAPRRSSGCGEEAPRPWDAMASTARLWAERPGAALELAGEGLWAAGVTVDASRCHLCGRCARCCPTGALRLGSDDAVSLGFRPGRCPAGCGLCAEACPHGALEVAPRLRWPWRPEVLVAERRRACPRCGRTWDDAVALPGVAQRLRGTGGEPPPELVCPACRRERLTAAAARLFRREESDGQEPGSPERDVESIAWRRICILTAPDRSPRSDVAATRSAKEEGKP